MGKRAQPYQTHRAGGTVQDRKKISPLHGVDGRSAWVRRFRDIIANHLSDLGGADNVSYGELFLVRRTATMTVELELMEKSFAEKGASAEMLDLFQRVNNTVRRNLEALGLKRRAIDVSTELNALLVGRDDGKANE